MARRSSVRYFESRGAYYTQINGAQQHLATGPDDGPSGPTYKAAVAKFSELVNNLCDAHKPRAYTVGEIVVEFLGHIQGKRAPATVALRRKQLRAFAAVHGDRTAASLRHCDLSNFLSGRKAVPGRGRVRGAGLAANTVRGFYASLSACFRWASKPGVGLLASNPLAGFECPSKTSRGREAVLTPDQHSEVLRRTHPADRGLVVCLENTGARPGELLAASAAAWDDRQGALVYHEDATRGAGEFRHKGAGRGKTRVILFTGEALALVRGLVALYPTGPLFRTRRGKPISLRAVNKRFERTGQRCGIPGLTAYCYRHTLATRWLLAGRSVDQLAALLGNTPAVLREHYSHLLADVPSLRSELEDFRQAPEPRATGGGAFRVVG